MSSIKTVIGLMSGTSMDGIDAALIRTDGMNFLEIKAHASLTYAPEFKALLKTALQDAEQITDRKDRPNNLKSIEKELTEKHLEAVKLILKNTNMSSSQVDIIGFHGQTILHRPQQALTVQLGDGQLLANETGIDVVYDMRANDMEHGGQGAPLVPIYHQALLNKLAKENMDEIKLPVCFINIGGISNLTYIDENENLIAFDCGPGNALIDQWMKYKTSLDYDNEGLCGLMGNIDNHIVDIYKQHPFFKQNTAGSLDWRDFSPLDQVITANDISTHDGAATLAFITAYGIIHSLRLVPHMPKTLIISGGGAQNGAIMKYLTELANNFQATTKSSDQLGMNSEFIEADAWGYLAVRSLYNLPLTFPSTTGCKSPVSGGVLAPYKQ